MSKDKTWRNRIVGEGAEAPDQLLANPLNFRVHPRAQQEAMAGVLQSVGVVQRVIVNKRTGYVVDGHMRVALAISQGEPSIPVVYVDLSPDEEALVLATFDTLGADAGFDGDLLDQLLRTIDTSSAELQAYLDELAQDAGLVPGAAPLASGLFPGGSAAPATAAGPVPFAAGSDEDDDDAAPGDDAGLPGAGGLVPNSHVRMLQLFLDTQSHPLFLRHASALSTHFGTDNVTDTVLRCVQYATEALGLAVDTDAA